MSYTFFYLKRNKKFEEKKKEKKIKIGLVFFCFQKIGKTCYLKRQRSAKEDDNALALINGYLKFKFPQRGCVRNRANTKKRR